MMVMQKLFFLVVLSCTHKQAHIVHINTHQRKKTKKKKHMDIKTKVMNTTHTRKNHIHLNRENNDGDIRMFFIPHFVPKHT